MDFLQNYTVGKRLTAGFALLLIFIVAMVVVATHGLSVTRQHLDQVVNLNGEKTRLLSEMMESQAGTAVARRDFLLAPDQTARDAAMKNLAQYRERYVAAAKTLSDKPGDATGLGFRRDIASAFDNAVKVAAQVTELGNAGDIAGASAYMLEHLAPAQQRWQDAIKRNIEHQQMLNAKSSEAANTSTARNRLLLIVLGGVAVVAGMVLAMLITRSLTRPLTEATQAARAIAAANAAPSTFVRPRRAGGRRDVRFFSRGTSPACGGAAARHGPCRGHMQRPGRIVCCRRLHGRLRRHAGVVAELRRPVGGAACEHSSRKQHGRDCVGAGDRPHWLISRDHEIALT